MEPPFLSRKWGFFSSPVLPVISMGFAVFDEKLEIIATIKNDETFVALETSEGIGMSPEIFLGATLHKLQILTTDGKIGYTSFWYDEIELVKTL